jgi:hypothetical protein
MRHGVDMKHTVSSSGNLTQRGQLVGFGVCGKIILKSILEEKGTDWIPLSHTAVNCMRC